MTGKEITVLTALMAGVIGSVHCIGMCGGIVGVISASLKNSKRASMFYWSGYHSGRIFSYSVAGFLAGVFGEQIYKLFPMERTHEVGAMISGLFIILLGMHIAGWWRALTKLEVLGARLWQKISPYLLKLLPPRALKHALLAGVFWGWLPCGLVYSVLILTATTGSGTYGAVIMLVFGLGTLPMLFGMGFIAHKLTSLKIGLWLRNLFGITISGFGVITFLGLVAMR